jgi:hypothetical protein
MFSFPQAGTSKSVFKSGSRVADLKAMTFKWESE